MRQDSVDPGDDRCMILLEGNIGSGKSTLGVMAAESEKFAFIPEPVDEWRRADLLRLFYEDPWRWAFTFQLNAFTTRAKTWDEILALTDHSRVMLERSIYCDRYVFAKNCWRQGLMNDDEWGIYCRMWDWLEARWCTPPDHTVYLRTPVGMCLDRIKLRGREEEQSIAPSYLIQLEDLHDEWLLDDPRTIIVEPDGPYYRDGFVDLEALDREIAQRNVDNGGKTW